MNHSGVEAGVDYQTWSGAVLTSDIPAFRYEFQITRVKGWIFIMDNKVSITGKGIMVLGLQCLLLYLQKVPFILTKKFNQNVFSNPKKFSGCKKF